MTTTLSPKTFPTGKTKAETAKFSFRNVSVKYGDVQILEDVNLDTYGPGLISIAGANGVGKTTLLKLACGVSLPTTGEVFVDGLNTAKNWSMIRKKIGVSLYSERCYHFRLTGFQNLLYFGRLAGMRKAEIVAQLAVLGEEFSIDPLMDRHFSELSLGQRKIFGMIVAFVLSDELVILDEPTATLDEHNSLAVLSMINWAIAEGKTVLITTHDPKLIENSHQVISL